MHCWLRLRNHAWDGCVCRLCGLKRDEGHDWQVKWLQYSEEKSVVCVRCGALFDVANSFHIQDVKKVGFWVHMNTHTYSVRSRSGSRRIWNRTDYFLENSQERVLIRTETTKY